MEILYECMKGKELLLVFLRKPTDVNCNRPTDVQTLGGFYCRRVVTFHCELF
jgi:hypothetical protein